MGPGDHAGFLGKILLRYGQTGVVELLYHSPVSFFSLLCHIQKSGCEFPACGLDEKPQQMDLALFIKGGNLHAGNHGDSQLFSFRHSFPQAGDGVMVCYRQGGKAGLLSQTDQFPGSERTVGGGGVGMQEMCIRDRPTVEAGSENYREMLEKGYLIASETGSRMTQLGNACFADMTNPEAREYIWGKIRDNYYKYGIKVFWLDEAEPEMTAYDYSNFRYHRGADLEIGNLYPREYAKMAYEGMEKEGQENILNLLRCAWAGSQKYGALVWSGDIDSSFRSLRSQFAAGLNMGIAGIPWWTTDIGGFHGGNINDPAFKECLTRWFQFGAFSPVFRLHGDREPHKKPLTGVGGGAMPSGADNEVWTYGEEVYAICKKYLLSLIHI